MSFRVVRARVAVVAVAALAGGLLAPASGGASAARDDDNDLVDVTGTVLVLAGEGDRDRYSLLLPSGRTVELAEGFEAEPLSSFDGTLALPGDGSGTTLTGAARSGALARAESAGTALEVVDSREVQAVVASGPAPGPTAHTTYVARVTNFGAFPSGSASNAQVLAAVGAAQSYWIRESSGQIASWSTVGGVTSVASDVGSAARGCGLGTGGADFSAIATHVGTKAFPGIDFSGTSPNHLVVVVPDGCGGTVAGRARLGDSFASGGPVIIESALASFEAVLEHELGHNVSLHHANNVTAEYGDLYEVMGASPSGFNSPALGTVYRWEQGIIADGEVVDGTAGGGPWPLAPRSATTGQRSVTFVNPDDGVRHFVDNRTGTLSDASTYYASGSTTTRYGQTYSTGIVVERENDEAGSFLLKPTSSNDGALQGNEAWTNAGGTLTVRGNGNNVTITRQPGQPFTAAGTLTMTAPTALRTVTVAATGFIPAPAAVTYQWTFNGQPIAGATDTRYQPSPAMAGGQLGVSVTAYATGREPLVRTTSQAVAPADWYAVGARRTPVAEGTRQVGATLTALGLDWVNYYSAKPADLTTTYQWLRNGQPIAGATGTTYVLSPADAGAVVQVAEYPRAAGYDTTYFARSSGGASVLPGRLVSARPKITGKPRVGKSVKAKAAGWTAGTTFSYKWFLGKKAIKGAKKAKLKITRSMRGKKLTVKVTGKLGGYTSVSAKSRPAKVR